jgi:VTC domain.
MNTQTTLLLQDACAPQDGITDTRSPALWNLGFEAAAFRGISLSETESVALLDRVDTKFVLPLKRLEYLLPLLKEDYRALTIEGCRLQPYQNLYFDTPDFALFRLQVNQRAHQYKVRVRVYESTQEAFLEIKHKTPKGRTLKSRLAVDARMPFFGLSERLWLAENLPAAFMDLEPVLGNCFTRLVLVDNAYSERVTLDAQLSFSAGWKSSAVSGAVIAEVKQSQAGSPSAFLEMMRAERLRQIGFSKYCVGVSSLYGQVKSNLMKEKLRLLEKLSGE